MDLHQLHHPSPPAALDEQSWSWYAQRAGIEEGEGLLLALSGGADSMLLLRLLALSRPRPRFRVLHVQHGLRGAESSADEAFCRASCEQLGAPFRAIDVTLDPLAGSLENQARQARYRVLRQEARSTQHLTILTGHQAQDVLETQLWRWIRGSAPEGLCGPSRRLLLRGEPDQPPVQVVRPLLDLERDQVRAQLEALGATWREDGSNLDPRFTRNRLRLGLLPLLERVGGAPLLRKLSEHARVLERLEARLEALTQPARWSLDGQGLRSVKRPSLEQLHPQLQRRALWRLITQATGRGPRGALLERILADLRAGRRARHTLGGAWSLELERDFLLLAQPKARQPR